MSTPRILFIDAYDSFTNNIVSLIETELKAKVTTIHIDKEIEDFGAFLEPFDAVIAGPGPGHPGNTRDVGLISQLWNLSDEQLKPVLGICLGFQSLVFAFGGKVERLSRARHGISTNIETTGDAMFDGIFQFESIQYHSLHASMGPALDQWQTSELCPELMPLAWDKSSHEDGSILMSVKHRSKPFWGIQFHPESICSSVEGKKVIHNWWKLCTESSPRLRQPSFTTPLDYYALDLLATYDSTLVSNSPGTSSTTISDSASSSRSITPQSQATSYTSRAPTPIEDYSFVSIPVETLEIPQIIGQLDLAEKELIVLDSERRCLPEVGRYSIIGVIEPQTTKITYKVGSNSIKVVTGKTSSEKSIDSIGSVFTYIKGFLAERKISTGTREIPFWGGLLGYIDYEACLETIDVHAARNNKRDNLSFAFVERSIVIDHAEGVVYIQSIKAGDQKWIDTIQSKLMAETTPSLQSNSISQHLVSARHPLDKEYKEKIAECQEQIRSGNSYELCLTNQATFTTESPEQGTDWQKYRTLRTLNPAPFTSYMRLGSATILSTSPERFMRWTRPTVSDKGILTSTCQFRPIKGTVQKEQVLLDGSIRKADLQEATKLLSSVKERAENLMIVDLIRHDLHGVVGSGNVRVPSLMQVEEYSTMYQLVSVIEGDIHSDRRDGNGKSGIDVLAASLPPGSMTGAPKKRACEILKDLEDEPRSIYSGVMGYMCVGGAGDFSVAIRTVFKWDDEDVGTKKTWRIGAGGAITILSDPQDEWEEMQAKLRSTQRLFEETH